MSTDLYHHLLGTAITAVAFLTFARGILKRQRGRRFNPTLPFLLMVGAMVVHAFFGGEGIFARGFFILTDLGLGMMLAGIYLFFNGGQGRLLVVPGMLALFIGLGGAAMSRLFYSCTEWVGPSSQVDELLVELGPDDHPDEIAHTLSRFGARIEKLFPALTLEDDEDLAQYYVVWVDESQSLGLIADLESDGENVDKVSRNNYFSLDLPEVIPVSTRFRSSSPVNDPMFSQQWYAAALHYEQVFDLLRNHPPRKKIRIGIVDTGVDGGHEDLSPVYGKSSGNTDSHGHGTHCAGLAGAATNNGLGVASLNLDGKYLSVSGYHALDKSGRGSDKTVAKGIVDAVMGGADIISLSLGGIAPFGAPKVQTDAIKFAQKKGVIVFAAAGNSNQDARFFAPANIEGVIVVAAVGPDMQKAPFSNTNTSLAMPLAAPGVDMISSLPGNTYQRFSGTSMATPLAAGLAGIIKSLQPDLDAKAIYQLMHNTGLTGPDANRVGRVVQPGPALRAAMKARANEAL